jgi:hypothetical protein
MCKIKLLLFLFAASVSWTSADAQTKTISGRVISSDDGKPLQNVTVSVKGRSGGVSADEEGKYKISAQKGDILTVSYAGYNEKEIVV